MLHEQNRYFSLLLKPTASSLFAVQPVICNTIWTLHTCLKAHVYTRRDKWLIGYSMIYRVPLKIKCACLIYNYSSMYMFLPNYCYESQIQVWYCSKVSYHLTSHFARCILFVARHVLFLSRCVSSLSRIPKSFVMEHSAHNLSLTCMSKTTAQCTHNQMFDQMWDTVCDSLVISCSIHVEQTCQV